MLWSALLLLTACYLIGSVPTAVIVSRLVRGIDLREHGTGNMGATNAGRVLGKKWFVVVFLLDFLKGGLATYLARALLPGLTGASADLAAAMGAFAAVAGHCFPIYVGFKGGVGLAASAGALVIINFWMLAAVGLSILLFWNLLKNMYMGTVIACALAPLYAWIFLRQGNVTLAVAAWAVMIIGLHTKDVKAWWANRRAG
jgi:glycerol-3-phosphate acyltransferase PlsY